MLTFVLQNEKIKQRRSVYKNFRQCPHNKYRISDPKIIFTSECSRNIMFLNNTPTSFKFVALFLNFGNRLLEFH